MAKKPRIRSEYHAKKFRPGWLYVPINTYPGHSAFVADENGVLRDNEGNLAPTDKKYRKLPNREKKTLSAYLRGESERLMDLANLLRGHAKY